MKHAFANRFFYLSLLTLRVITSLAIFRIHSLERRIERLKEEVNQAKTEKAEFEQLLLYEKAIHVADNAFYGGDKAPDR